MHCRTNIVVFLLGCRITKRNWTNESMFCISQRNKSHLLMNHLTFSQHTHILSAHFEFFFCLFWEQELSHPNIVRYLGSERVDDKLNIFLEYQASGSIAQLLARFKPFNESLIRNFTKQILLGLEYLHSHGIAHRGFDSPLCFFFIKNSEKFLTNS